MPIFVLQVVLFLVVVFLVVQFLVVQFQVALFQVAPVANPAAQYPVAAPLILLLVLQVPNRYKATFLVNLTALAQVLVPYLVLNLVAVQYPAAVLCQASALLQVKVLGLASAHLRVSQASAQYLVAPSPAAQYPVAPSPVAQYPVALIQAAQYPVLVEVQSLAAAEVQYPVAVEALHQVPVLNLAA